MASPTAPHSYNVPAPGPSPHLSLPLGYPQQPPFGVPLHPQGYPSMNMPLGHLHAQMTYGGPQQRYPHPFMMAGVPPYTFGGPSMAPNAPTPESLPTQTPQVPPAAPLPYTETRVPQGTPVEPLHLTEGERHSEQCMRQPRDPSIERLRETATCSCPTPAHPSSQDEEVDDLCAEVDRLQRDRLSLQHNVDRIRLERDQIRECLELVEEQLSSRRPHR